MEEVKIEEPVTEAPVEQVTDIDTANLFAPQRLQGESYQDYRERRLVANYKLHEMAKGRLIWNSRPDPTKKGDTYRKVK